MPSSSSLQGDLDVRSRTLPSGLNTATVVQSPRLGRSCGRLEHDARREFPFLRCTAGRRPRRRAPPLPSQNLGVRGHPELAGPRLDGEPVGRGRPRWPGPGPRSRRPATWSAAAFTLTSPYMADQGRVGDRRQRNKIAMTRSTSSRVRPGRRRRRRVMAGPSGRERAGHVLGVAADLLAGFRVGREDVVADRSRSRCRPDRSGTAGPTGRSACSGRCPRRTGGCPGCSCGGLPSFLIMYVLSDFRQAHGVDLGDVASCCPSESARRRRWRPRPGPG